MFAIRARRKVASERDFLDAVEKVVRQGTKFSSTSVFCLSVCSQKLNNFAVRYIKCTISCIILRAVNRRIRVCNLMPSIGNRRVRECCSDED